MSGRLLTGSLNQAIGGFSTSAFRSASTRSRRFHLGPPASTICSTFEPRSGFENRLKAPSFRSCVNPGPEERAKRKALNAESKLLLNARVAEHDIWDEQSIDARGEWLAAELAKIWPGPARPAAARNGST